MSSILRGSARGAGDGGDDTFRKRSHKMGIQYLLGRTKKSKRPQNSEQFRTDDNRRMSTSSGGRHRMAVQSLLNSGSASGSRGSGSGDPHAASRGSSSEKRRASDAAQPLAGTPGSSRQRQSIQFLLNSISHSRSSSQGDRPNLPLRSSLHHQMGESNVMQTETRSPARGGPSSVRAPTQPDLDEDEITPAPPKSRASRTRGAAGPSRLSAGGPSQSVTGGLIAAGSIDEHGYTTCTRCKRKFRNFQKHVQAAERCSQPGCNFVHCDRSKLKAHMETHDPNWHPTAESAETLVGGLILLGPTDEYGKTYCFRCREKFINIQLHLQSIYKCSKAGCSYVHCLKCMFERHMRSHKPKESSSFSCPTCGKKFTQKGNANMHRKICKEFEKEQK